MNKRFILLVLRGLSSISPAQYSLSGYTFDIIIGKKLPTTIHWVYARPEEHK